MKKHINLFLVIILVLIVVGCSSEEKLYLLNVGDYIDESILSDFEEDYYNRYGKRITVVFTELNSNEEIYQKLKNETYDLCFISDYMIERMYSEGMLKRIDESRLDSYSKEALMPSAKEFIDENCSSYKDYFIPYFWGTVGILYSTRENEKYDVAELEEELKEKGLSIMFEENIYDKGMYNNSRDAICMSMLSQSVISDDPSLNNIIDINSSDEEYIRRYGLEPLKNTTYKAWGDDSLKAMVSQGQLDLALVYSGDYLDEQYQCECDNQEIEFKYYAPEVTNIWIDGIAYLSNSENDFNVYAFLNYFMQDEVQAQNADAIGYCPLIQNVFDLLWNEGGDYEYELSYDYDFFVPQTTNRVMYHHVSVEHCNLLNDLLDEAKSK